MNPSDLKYTESHEWVRIEGNKGIVGITGHAQEQMGDIVFVDLPEEGKSVEKGGMLASIESVKSVSDVYSPVFGNVVEVNEKLLDSPETINQDPYGEGWIAVVEITDTDSLSQLLSADEYESKI